ncbi:MAG: hypothetical protein GWO23_21225 [Gammaproteobacteria bacterium]|nr:hypothetical protein [Gammaproteobacteria bacterium]
MNWDAISAVAEMLGALAVVASLVYVGRQVSQNTAMMRVAASSDTVERDHGLVLPLIESEELAEIWLKGDHRLSELSEANRQRLLLFERRAITLWHHNYQLRIQGLLSDAVWHYQNAMIRFLSQRQSMREAWGIFKDTFEPSFQTYVDDQFRAASIEPSE